ncbi:hypothetical protein DYI37_08010 [Fulvimarina endophytica]|uniref:Uncharacterized protein n=1 Tax=Fulvimarina endophytica TaxID=2293836 RepID=A0A371X5F6_9HYPH|nr:hypothetical protein [Fulvimarina endophytica]RFC64274.1 hypothetical protein DYI37_08010 [Fulvimarina endophytica]
MTEFEYMMRLVEGEAAPRNGDVVHVVLDQAGRPVDRSSRVAQIGGRLFGKRHVYRFDLARTVRLQDVSSVFRPFLADERTELDFRLEVAPVRDRLETTAQALHSAHESPHQVLLGILRSIFGDLVDRDLGRGSGDIRNRILSDRERWEAEIVREIEARTGLKATMILQGAVEDGEITIETSGLEVVPRDLSQGAVRLRVKAVIEPTFSARRDTRLPETDIDRIALLDGVVGAAFRNEIWLYDYWYDVPTVERVLTERLDGVLASSGYRCRTLRTDPSGSKPNAEEQVLADIVWTGPKKREIRFTIDATFRLMREGGGRYDRTGPQPRKLWLEKRGLDAIKLAMHQREFFDLSNGELRRITDEVGAMLAAYAETEIGHRIDPVTTGANLPERRWFSTNSVDVPKAAYWTKHNVLQVEIAASAQVSFEKLGALIDYLDQRTTPRVGEGYDAKIETLVRTTMQSAIRETMEQIEYSGFFEQWEPPADMRAQIEAGRGTPFVRPRIETAIRARLKEIGASVGEVSVRAVDTQLKPFIDRLRSFQTIIVTGMVFPKGAKSRPEERAYAITMGSLSLQPDGVATILQNGLGALTRESMEGVVRNAAEPCLKTMTSADLDALDEAGSGGGRMSAEFGTLETIVRGALLRNFGFVVTLERVEVKTSELALLGRDVHSESYDRLRRIYDDDRYNKDLDREFERRRRESLTEQLEHLYNLRRSNRMVTDSDIRSARQIDQEIERLTEERLRLSLPAEGRHRSRFASEAKRAGLGGIDDADEADAGEATDHREEPAERSASPQPGAPQRASRRAVDDYGADD